MVYANTSLMLYQGRFTWDTRENIWVVNLWNRLHREVVESPSLEAFRNHLHVALRDMV